MIRGKDFERLSVPYHGPPELYFEGPVFTAKVKKVSFSITWKDQGWGNLKGEIFIKLMRADGHASGSPEEIAEKRHVLGVAQHEWSNVKATLGANEPIVNKAQPGDFYRFMRLVGGGGGHQLFVRNFKAIVSLAKY